MKQWVKLWTEVVDDPDMDSLSLAEQGIWMRLLALAGKLDARDEDGNETGQLDTLDRVAWHIRVGVDELAAAVDAFTQLDMVDWRDGLLFVTHYGKRQARPPSEQPAAVTERVKRHRQKATPNTPPLQNPVTDCNESVTDCNGPRSRADTEAEQDSEQEADTEAAADTDADAPRALLSAAAGPDRGNGNLDIPPECSVCLRKVANRAEVLGLQPRRARDVCMERGPKFAALWIAEIEGRVYLDQRDPLSSGKPRVQNPAGLLVEMVRTGSDPPEPPYGSWVWDVVCREECLPVRA